ncbi:MAG TPA: 2-hydroxychromene-2-carboxylate isomerase [Caldimonas sp.]|jgi:2-hydroxychromene-2-carboxylate isomerase|nr:2-hydroxychromene-2-carboxylate isomerase [Caldimonas sp.]HEX4232911.1 2-hydroxychromene-2-carboxylate isomerase [Caldimonas sp.]
MNAPKLEVFFDVGSPTSYLAWTQLPRIAAETGAAILWRPMLLGGVFKATGNASPVLVPAKGRWMTDDIQRFATRYGVPFRFNPHFPINTLTLMRGATGMQMRSPADFARYLDVIERAMWEIPKNLGDPDVLATALADAGFDPAAFAMLVADPEVKAKLIATTDEAVARGVFGAPTFFVGDAMHFGQDRLDFVQEALLAVR